MNAALSRRALFRAAGALTVAFMLPRPAAAGPKSLALGDVEAYLTVAPDGAVTIYAGKVDLGTGARIALPQIVADELGARLDRIALIEGDTQSTPDQGSTGGSTGIPIGAMQIRQAAATARERLLSLAAAKLNQPATALDATDGEIRPKSGGPGLSFAALLEGQDLALKVDPKAPLKPVALYRFVGKSLARPDVPGKMTATHTYVHDIRLPGMLHARVIRPPSLGAELVSVDAASIAAIPGARIVRRNNFLAVAAPREWNAVRAARDLVAVWREAPPPGDSATLYADIRATPTLKSEDIKRDGDAQAILAAAPRLLAASYHWPIQSHASMGPSCAVADVTAAAVTVWSASQGTHRLRRTIAQALGRDPAQVRVIYTDGSGSYGTNGNDDAAADAALISHALAAPVRVQWSRQDELAWDPKGPAHILDMRAALDHQGAIAAWESTAHLPMNTPGLPGIPLLPLDAAGIAQPQGLSAGQLAGNSDTSYRFPAQRAAVRWLASTPLRPSNLRAPGKIANAFAVECFLDECAAAAGADPLDYRLARLADPRAREALSRLGTAMAWQPRPSPVKPDPNAAILRGRGIAYAQYKQAENYVAMGMEISIERATGAIRVGKIFCAHDCGLMINPDNVRAQVEGCILQTLSRTLFEEVTFAQGRVTSTDWSSYPILTMPDAPALDIILIDRPNDRPLGAGEAACAPVAAALGNAIFDATGVRLRTVPFTPLRLKTAMGQGA